MEKIEDFGEYIPGAKKELYSKYRDTIINSGHDFINEPMSKAWPKLNYDSMEKKGMPLAKLNLLRVLRETLPKKPTARFSYRLNDWNDVVSNRFDMYCKYLNMDFDKEIDADDVSADISYLINSNDNEAIHMPGRLLMLTKFGSKAPYDSTKVYWHSDRETGEMICCLYVYGNMVGEAATVAEAMDMAEPNIKGWMKLNEEKSANKSSKNKAAYEFLDVSYKNAADIHYIGIRYNKKLYVLDPNMKFDTAEGVHEYLKNNRAEAERLADIMFKDIDERNKENRNRIGVDYRNGMNVTPSMFTDTFGFRGTQFGNYVGGKERQNDLNDAYDALVDLADILNIPPEKLSLNGELALAFGARGSGGIHPAKAHYESEDIVINLTKKNGAGSLAHEWFHALDHKLARIAFDVNKPLFFSETYRTPENIGENVFNAWKELHHKVCNSDMVKRSRANDLRRTKDYWSTNREMMARAFESYIREKLTEKNAENDYLVNFKDEQEYGSEYMDRYVYLTSDELKTVSPAFDKFFDAMGLSKGKEEALYSTADGRDIDRMLRRSSIVLPEFLSDEAHDLVEFSKEILGINMVVFRGPEKLHGKYCIATDTMYINESSQLPMEWIMWHEGFHVMKQHSPEIFEDIMSNIHIRKQDLDEYKLSIHRPNMSDELAKEEMVADAFADIKEKHQIEARLDKMYRGNNRGYIGKIVGFVGKVVDEIKLHLVREKAKRLNKVNMERLEKVMDKHDLLRPYNIEISMHPADRVENKLAKVANALNDSITRRIILDNYRDIIFEKSKNMTSPNMIYAETCNELYRILSERTTESKAMTAMKSMHRDDGKYFDTTLKPILEKNKKKFMGR